MKHLFIFLAIPLALISCKSKNNLDTPSQGTVIATIISYQEAKLTGDVTSAMHVTFDNTTKSAGRIGGNQSAILSLTGLPTGWITQVTVWMHSNASSGAGILNVTIGNDLIISYEGAFKDWVGQYIATSQPISFSKPICYDGAEIVVAVDGLVNSLYLDKVEISYSATYPSARALKLYSWTNDHQYQCQVIRESSYGAGISLPNCENVVVEDCTWLFTGWVEDSLLNVTYAPFCWNAGEQYIPSIGKSLFALYTNRQLHSIRQMIMPQSGEYMLCHMENNAFSLAAKGVWEADRLAIEAVSIRFDTDAHCWMWCGDTIDDGCRYDVTFKGDSLLLFNKSTEKYIGHNASSASLKATFWAWKQARDNSYFIHHDLKYVQDSMYYIKEHDTVWTDLSCWQAKAISYDDYQTTITYMSTLWDSCHYYWLLFPTIDIPSTVSYHWTTQLL